MARTASTIEHPTAKIRSSVKNKKSVIPCKINKLNIYRTDEIKVIWNEFFTLVLTGDVDEVLAFDIMRQNSCEGNIKIDSFVIRMNEEASFFEKLRDQANHFMTFQSSLSPALMAGRHMQSMETMHSNTSSESQYRVMLRWRYEENTFKIVQIKKKIEQIEHKLSE